MPVIITNSKSCFGNFLYYNEIINNNHNIQKRTKLYLFAVDITHCLENDLVKNKFKILLGNNEHYDCIHILNFNDNITINTDISQI